MSGYRSLKRVLGETNLERKCRWLFGICVGGLIFLAFWWVDVIAEGLIDGAAQFRGRAAVSETMIDVHWQKWVTEDDQQELQRKMVAVLSRQGHPAKLLTLDPDTPTIASPTSVFRPEVPKNDFELQLLAKLYERAEREFKDAAAAAELPADGSGAVSAVPTEPLLPKPVFEAFPLSETNDYYYYEVVYWSADCNLCHEQFSAKHAESAAFGDPSVFDANKSPFRVVRVSMPYEETRAAIDRTRAVLITVGIVTMSLSMIAL
jgi:two-component system, NarL family, sensor histidine kinase BarA